MGAHCGNAIHEKAIQSRLGHLISALWFLGCLCGLLPAPPTHMGIRLSGTLKKPRVPDTGSAARTAEMPRALNGCGTWILGTRAVLRPHSRDCRGLTSAAPDQLGTPISTVHQALAGLDKTTEVAVERTAAIGASRDLKILHSPDGRSHQ